MGVGSGQGPGQVDGGGGLPDPAFEVEDGDGVHGSGARVTWRLGD